MSTRAFSLLAAVAVALAAFPAVSASWSHHMRPLTKLAGLEAVADPFELLNSLQRPDRPRWPTHWSANWTIFVKSDDPATPYPGGPRPPFYPTPPGDFLRGSGHTDYDWDFKGLQETYNDFCVPIFSSGFQFPCRFSVSQRDPNRQYLVSDTDLQPPCCRFHDNLGPVRPDFPSALEHGGYTVMYGQRVEWFYIDLPAHGGLFGYGFYEKPVHSNGTRAGASFFFRGIDTWVEQHFFDFVVRKPPAEAWNLPTGCDAGAGLPRCNWP